MLILYYTILSILPLKYLWYSSTLNLSLINLSKTILYAPLYIKYTKINRFTTPSLLINYLPKLYKFRWDLKGLSLWNWIEKNYQFSHNKSEEFTQFADWIAFASKVIPENLRHEQSKIIKYNHLMANMIMLYNVDQMTKVFNQLAKEGYPITPKILKAFAPYRNEHINRFGSYDSKLKWKVKPLQHELVIPQK